jgi:transcriptional regulator
MYRPNYTKNENQELAIELIKEYPLGLLISKKSGESVFANANYLPLIVSQMGDGMYLLGHFAKSNTDINSEDNNVLVNFLGPQRYISPTIYYGTRHVPTWNYATVQVTGSLDLVSNPLDLKDILIKSTQFFEEQNNTSWVYDLPEDKMKQLESAIVGFRIKVLNIEAKFKLSQNRSEEDNEVVSNFLKNSENDRDQEMYKWMGKLRQVL